mmetsp:Transcript_2667/g.4485  ORF Transcript_2667/g.4485 Transcript_2667/m.4485 type:complete len:132 (-) Transcript_2667:1181-1576(-)
MQEEIDTEKLNLRMTRKDVASALTLLIQHDMVGSSLVDFGHTYEVKTDSILLRMSLPRYIDSLIRQYGGSGVTESTRSLPPKSVSVSKQCQAMILVVLLIAQYGTLHKSEVVKMILGGKFQQHLDFLAGYS